MNNNRSWLRATEIYLRDLASRRHDFSAFASLTLPEQITLMSDSPGIYMCKFRVELCTSLDDPYFEIDNGGATSKKINIFQ